MKAILSLSILLFSASALATEMNCSTPNKINGWTGRATFDYLIFDAHFDADKNLKNAEIKGAYASDSRDLKADENYKPTSPRYFNHLRYQTLEDAWNWFDIILPNDFILNAPGKTYIGFARRFTEQGYAETTRLLCKNQ